MAGTFGLKEANFEVSLAAGAAMLQELKRERFHVGSSECSPCRMQMEQGTSKPCLHPVQFLALAHGLASEPPPVDLGLARN
jgi:Fe-S oxidoreductase